jgi:phage terminase large subunit-like protein
MEGSITHQLVKHAKGEETAEWINEENFDVHYYPALIENEDGTASSIWPEKWTVEYLQSIAHTRAFQKNFQNTPLSNSDAFWSPESIRYGESEYRRTVLSIDPAVTSGQVSDYTGFAVVSDSEINDNSYVRYADRGKLSPKEIRKRVLELLEMFPDIGVILIETNQGGDTWKEILEGVPVRVKTIHQKASKLARAERVLNKYEMQEVFHVRRFNALETELLAFPNGLNDDMVDSVVTGVTFLKFGPKKKTVTAHQSSY